MLCISMVDLLPSAVEELGFACANLWFYLGAAFFAVVVIQIPRGYSLLGGAPGWGWVRGLGSDRCWVGHAGVGHRAGGCTYHCAAYCKRGGAEFAVLE